MSALPQTQQNNTELELQSSAILRGAEQLVVNSGASYEAAAEYGKGIKSIQKRITDWFAPMKSNAHATWKGICRREEEMLSPVGRAETIVKQKMLDFRRAEQRRQDDERREKEAVARKLEEDRRLQEALDIEEEGDTVAAMEVISAPILPPVIPASAAPAPKVAGVGATKRWTFDETTTDLSVLIAHIAGVEKVAHPELVCLLALDTKAARQLITAMKAAFNVPGIRAYEAEGLSLGRG